MAAALAAGACTLAITNPIVSRGTRCAAHITIISLSHGTRCAARITIISLSHCARGARACVGYFHASSCHPILIRRCFINVTSHFTHPTDCHNHDRSPTDTYLPLRTIYHNANLHLPFATSNATRPLTHQSIHQSANPPIHQFTQPTNRPSITIHQSIHQSINSPNQQTDHQPPLATIVTAFTTTVGDQDSYVSSGPHAQRHGGELHWPCSRDANHPADRGCGRALCGFCSWVVWHAPRRRSVCRIRGVSTAVWVDTCLTDC
jgi:hypothetical protein